MRVGIDQPWHHDGAGRVDRVAAAGISPRSPSRYRPSTMSRAVDGDGAALDDAPAAVHGDDGAVGDDERDRRGVEATGR